MSTEYYLIPLEDESKAVASGLPKRCPKYAIEFGNSVGVPPLNGVNYYIVGIQKKSNQLAIEKYEDVIHLGSNTDISKLSNIGVDVKGIDKATDKLFEIKKAVSIFVIGKENMNIFNEI